MQQKIKIKLSDLVIKNLILQQNLQKWLGYKYITVSLLSTRYHWIREV